MSGSAAANVFRKSAVKFVRKGIEKREFNRVAGAFLVGILHLQVVKACGVVLTRMFISKDMRLLLCLATPSCSVGRWVVDHYCQSERMHMTCIFLHVCICVKLSETTTLSDSNYQRLLSVNTDVIDWSINVGNNRCYMVQIPPWKPLINNKSGELL